MPPVPDIPRALGSIQVLIRFALRMVLLGVFAALGSEGFGKTFASLVTLAVFYCIFAAAIRGELPFGPVLTHFDEAAAYAVTGGLASTLC